MPNLEDLRNNLGLYYLAVNAGKNYKWVRYQQLLVIPHLEAVERGEIQNLAIFEPPGHAKLCAHETLVPTPNGWKEHGDLQVNDEVFSLDGRPTRIIAQHPEALADVRVTMTDGSEFYVHENHEWTLFDRTANSWRTWETKYFLRQTKFGKATALRSGEHWLYKLPRSGAAAYSHRDLKLHPYVLGAWLGDGSTTKPHVTFPEQDRKIIDKIVALGYQKSAEWIHRDTGVLTASFGGERYYGGRLINELKSLNLIGRKHIPEIYKQASIDQRLELLAGLIDTDGSKDRGRGRYRIVTVLKSLADDIVDLIESFGWHASLYAGKIYNYPDDPIVSKQTPYYIGFNPSLLIPVALERKRGNEIPIQRKNTAIAEVERVGGKRKGKCITVADPAGLYLIGRKYIATHNSDITTRAFIPWYLGKNPTHNAMACSYSASLASDDFGATIKDRMQSDLHRQIFPDSTITRDSRSKTHFTTKKGGHFYSVGFGGGITGKRLDLLVLDDLIKGKAEAESAAEQQVLFDTYRAVIKDRMRPGGRKVMCIARGQRIMMGDGTWKPIETIIKGELVSTYDEKTRTTKQGKVIDAWSNGRADILRIISRSCETLATANHPFLVVKGGARKGGWRQRRTQADVIAARSWILEWKNAGNLRPGDVVVTIKSGERNNGYRPHLPNGLRADQDFYWLMGFLFGDGWLLRDKKRGIRGCAIAQSVYPDLNEHVESVYLKCFGRRLRSTKYGYWRDDTVENGEFLKAKGFFGNAKSKRIPGWIFRLRPCDKQSFLEGYLDADGYLRPAKRGKTWRAVSANRELLDDMRLLARGAGIRTTKIYHQIIRSPSPKSGKPRASALYSACFSFYPDKSEMKSRWSNQKAFGDYFRFEEIEHVESAGEEKVFDLTIEGTANFIAEGFVVHNCMHRWLIADIAGRILEMDGTVEEGGAWTVLKLPAEDPPDSGNFLWEEHYGKNYYLDFKKDDETWAAKFQQDPQSSTGYKFREEWLNFYDIAPPPGKFKAYIFVDPAAAKTKNSDYTVINVFCPAQERKLLLVDWVWDKLDPGERTEAILRLCRRWNPEALYYESYGLNADSYYLKEKMLDDNFPSSAYPRVVGKSGAGHNNSKEARIDALIPFYRNGKIVLPRSFERLRYDGTRVDYTKQFIEKEYRQYRGKKSVPHEDNLDCQSRIADPDVHIDYDIAPEVPARERNVSMPAGSSWYALY